MTGERPDPDALLAEIHADERRARGAQLRVFLGMAAGVGKTSAMLKAAHERLAEGMDVLIGIVETHGRVDTQRLTHALPAFPRQRLLYKGVELEELDLDGVLARRPRLVLVDELAHTNAPGSRHQKRYQDVLELLDAGIDVYTTINVQHLESRKDLVEQITGIQIRETVPDSVLERATHVELIDVTPEELLRRLKDGKVYLGDQAARAVDHFFQTKSLTALREIALRVTAERVDQDLQRLTRARADAAPLATNERLMVAISHSPHSEKLIRATRRLAYNLEAPWLAVHVDTGQKLSDEDQAQLARTVTLARELNGDVVTTSDLDVVSALRRIARQKNVTHIVVGRPSRRRVRDRIYGGTLLDRLVREHLDVDVHVIGQNQGTTRTGPRTYGAETFGRPITYWNAFWFLVGTSLLNGLMEPLLGYRAVGFMFLLGVLGVGLISTVGPTMFVAILSAMIWNYLFIPPRFTLEIREPADAILILTYLIAALVTGYLTNRIRTHERLLRAREDRTNVLFEVSQDVAGSRDQEESLTKVSQRVGHLLDGTCGVIVAAEGQLRTDEYKTYSPQPRLSESEIAVAVWAFEARKIAGWSTETLAEARSLYLPLRGPSQSVGVLVYTPRTKRKLALEEENLLFSIANQLAVSMERQTLALQAREAERFKESEVIHQTLLNSVSHELRTPLTAILGSATAIETAALPAAEPLRELAGQLVSAGQRLNQVIENLLDMSRLDSGALTLKLEWHDVNDLIGVTLQRLKRVLTDHPVHIAPVDLPLVRMDFGLMEHALANLILNAATYSSPKAPIELVPRLDGDFVELAVLDRGRGLPPTELTRVFEKFFRVPGSAPGGVGLGLSIVQSIVQLHKGHIRATNRDGGGAVFTIRLPLETGPRAYGATEETRS